jgi:adenosine deaminase
MVTIEAAAAAAAAAAECPVHLDAELLGFCRRLPTCELHAHLNGCVRLATILELAQQQQQQKQRSEHDELQRLTATGERARQRSAQSVLEQHT